MDLISYWDLIRLKIELDLIRALSEKVLCVCVCWTNWGRTHNDFEKMLSWRRGVKWVLKGSSIQFWVQDWNLNLKLDPITNKAMLILRNF